MMKLGPGESLSSQDCPGRSHRPSRSQDVQISDRMSLIEVSASLRNPAADNAILLQLCLSDKRKADPVVRGTRDRVPARDC